MMDDAFAGLLLTDPEDEQPQMTSREARIARAFEESKKGYALEVVMTPPGPFLKHRLSGSPTGIDTDVGFGHRQWFQIEHIQTNDLTKLEARNVEWSVQRLYLQKSYAAALQLAIEVLHAGGIYLNLATTSTSAKIGTDLTYDTLPKNEARDREMLDVAIRCAAKLGNRDLATSLAKASRSRWASAPGLAYTAGEAFVFADKPLDAISALLHAVRSRTPSYSVLSLLVQAFEAAEKNAGPGVTSFGKLAGIIGQYADRIRPAFERGLFPETSATPIPKPPPRSKSIVPTEAAARTMGSEAGLDERDVDLLVALCCVSDNEPEAGQGERSVRSL